MGTKSTAGKIEPHENQIDLLKARQELSEALRKIRSESHPRTPRGAKKKPDPMAFIKFVEERSSKLTSDDLDQIPHDGSINYKHYLYGHPKVEL